MDNELSKIIGERINTLLAKNEYKQKDLAEWTGIKPENTISYFCSGKRIPNTSQLKKIAEFFNTTTDYLLGLTPSPAKEVEYIKLTELTGLSDEAIEQLWEEYQGGWRGDNHRSNDIMNEFIRRGMLGVLVGQMTDYADYLEQHIETLSKVYQNALQQYEHFISDNSDMIISDGDSIQVFFPDEFQLLHLYENEDTSEQKKNMRLSLFEMSEIPKSFVTKYFSDLNRQYDELIERIKGLNTKITRMRIKKTCQALEQLGEEGEPDGDNQKTE